MKYCIYARVSTTYESQDSSFEVQTKELRKKIKVLYPDYSYVTTYGDQGISGQKEDRAAFQQMLSDAKLQKFDAIVTKSISRFARNARILLNVLEELEQLKIKVLFIEENIDTSQASQKFLLTVLGGLAEMEAQNTAAHIRESNNIKRVAGIPARKCAVPLGYIWDKKNKVILVDEDAAQLVNNVFHWFVNEHYSQGKIASMMMNSGFKPKRGALNIDRRTITKMLSNEKYIGIAKEKDSSTGKIFTFENAFPQIVDRALFEQAQEMLAVRTNPDYKRHETRLYPLSKICYCTICKRKNTRFTMLHRGDGYELEEPSGGIAFWGCKCLASNKTVKSCKTYKLSEEYIYEAIIEALVFAACGSKIGVEEHLFSNQNFNAFLDAINDSNKNYNIELKAYESRKSELDRQRRKEIDLYRQDIISEAEMKSNVKQIDKQIKNLVPPKSPETKQMNQEHLKQFLKAVKYSNNDILKAQQKCRQHLFELFKDKDFRRSIINTFVSKVWIGGDKFTVTIELKEPLVCYSHTFAHRAPCKRFGRESY